MEALQIEKTRGYEAEFKFQDGKARLEDNEYSPDELTIVKIYRFEGETSPGDEAILYCINTSDAKKGIIIDAYGVYSDSDFIDFLKQVKIEKRAG